RQTARDFHWRLLRATIETWRCVDEFVRNAKRIVRNKACRRESPQHSETAAGPAHLAYTRRSSHRFPRIRSRAARNVFQCEISAVRGNERAARFRRVPVAGK